MSLSTGCRDDAEEAARDRTFVDDLGHDVFGHVARDRKTDSHVAAAARDNRCIDPDHFAFQVQQRSARIAGIDRGIGLDEIFEIGDA